VSGLAFPAAAAEPGSTHVVGDVAAWFPGGGGFQPVTPDRLVDTRSGVGGVGRLTTGTPVEVVVAGRGGVPASGAAAVALNLTVTEPAASGFLRVWPGGLPVPATSNGNFVAGAVVANLAMVGLGARGTVLLQANVATHVVVDVEGWFPTGEGYSDVIPERLLDTRGSARLAPGVPRAVGVAGRAGVPGTGVTAVVVNVTVTEPVLAGWLRVFPSDQPQPPTSNVNFAAGETVANLVVVPPSATGDVSVVASAATHVVVDVVGYFTSNIVPLCPAQRLLDTRHALGAPGRFVSGTSMPVSVAGPAAAVPADAGALLLNLTVTEPTGSGWLAVAPGGSSTPSSNINFVGGETVANLVVVGLGAGGSVSVTGLVGAPPSAGCSIDVPHSLGMRGAGVWCVERTLERKGYQSTYVDGYYGTVTVAAVRCFQRDHGLVADGVTTAPTAILLGIWSGPTPTLTPAENPFTTEFTAWFRSAHPDACHFRAAAQRDGALYVFDTTLDRMPTASVVKVQIAGAVFLRLYDTGQELTATQRARMDDMIRWSDNAAASEFVAWLGGNSALEAYGRRLGMVDTVRSPTSSWGSTMTTPTDQLRLLRTVLYGEGGSSGPTTSPTSAASCTTSRTRRSVCR
jgi:peptidoglycan hydrolase-like protein with peptidoglycan-binding domain